MLIAFCLRIILNSGGFMKFNTRIMKYLGYIASSPQNAKLDLIEMMTRLTLVLRNVKTLLTLKVCLVLISLCSTGLAFLLDEQVVRQYRLIYVGETICLLTYGVSWMVHGRVFAPLADPRDVEDAEV